LPVPIETLDAQRRQSEVGRIRLGVRQPTGKTDKRGQPGFRPAKLETFRFTSSSEILIRQVADLYGGEPIEWSPKPSRKEWEVITPVKTLSVRVPPNPYSQWMEMWGPGVCLRRCTRRIEQISGKPCMCPVDEAERRDQAVFGKACKVTTRLNVMLSDIPGIGVWRLQTHSENAAVEIPGAADFLRMAGEAADYISGRLELHTRESSGKNGVVNIYPVAVLMVDGVTPNQLLSGQLPAAMTSGPQRAELEAGPVAVTVEWIKAQADDADSTDRVRELWAMAKENDCLDGDLGAYLTERAASLHADEPATAVVVEDVVDGELLDEDTWPEVPRHQP
jgi:hypothetical protein